MGNLAFITEPKPPVPHDTMERLQHAARIAASWPVMPRPATASAFWARVDDARHRLRLLEEFLTNPPALYSGNDARLAGCHAAMRELRSRFRLLPPAIGAVADKAQRVEKLPRVTLAGTQDEPRIAAAAGAYMQAVDGLFSESTFQVFMQALQAHEPLTVDELWDIALFLKFVLVESILDEARNLRRAPETVSPQVFTARLDSLRKLVQVDWEFLIEPLITFDGLLRQDPSGVYERMDFESRESYRKRVAYVARRSDCSESQVAQTALDLARQASQHPVSDARMQRRLVHVGYYLVGKGFPQLAVRVGFHPPISWRVRQFVLDHPEDFYITGIQVLTIFLMAAVIFPILPAISSFSAFAFAVVVLLSPAMQIAVEFVNSAITSFFDPHALPKFDFSKGIPVDYSTMVAVPSLLLSEKQVHELVRELEVRYVANRDPNLHFALVTDLADSVTKPNENDSHPLVDLAIRLIDDLNAKYRSQKSGAFILLHRHRVFNTRQGVWMGWERKRGKLLDLNKLLVGEYDAFPIKAGGIDALKPVRYILTLDSDSQLPRGTAARMVGAIAHPLNQAIIDPKLRIVVDGYGILQPRVGVTVSSTARSRFAAIYSGQSGFDIYTHATSDAYQDLFGEGIFTGKGIYEVAVLHAVLDRRFPRNALLSHDLIEGSYARVGLVSDIELVDDYPSHYNAYSRRQHRWLRGDWQIVQWMFSRVPEESGRWTENPISDISRWKIFDNLRRSLVDPTLLLLFVAGWLGLPGGPIYWTIVTLLLLFLPAMGQLVFDTGRAILSGRITGLSGSFSGFGRACLMAFLHLIFLAQQTFLTFDAIVRSLIRSFITGERLLEWETAAQAEQRSSSHSGIDRYMFVMPFLSVALAAVVWVFAAHRIPAIICAAPILTLWGLANPVSVWLNRPPREKQRLSTGDIDFLLVHALRIWRYFAEYGTERHKYLLPDNVEEDGFFEAARISPTNIGLLLNARQVACELGFLTAPEFADLTPRSLETITRLEKFRGHLHNWYDTHSLRVLGSGPENASFISTVDSGNFVASLYTLHTGAIGMLRKPLLPHRLFIGLRAHWHLMRKECKLPAAVTNLHIPGPSAPAAEWIAWLPEAQPILAEAAKSSFEEPHNIWWLNETLHRVEALLSLLHDYLPWLLPEYASQLKSPQAAHPSDLKSATKTPLDQRAGEVSIAAARAMADSYLRQLEAGAGHESGSPDEQRNMIDALRRAKQNLDALTSKLQTIDRDSERLAGETDFSFLVDPEREILSIGYDMARNAINKSHYDLVASEARIATYLAIANGQLPQQSWFKLSRDHTFAYGQFILLSWTGTMFEYLMPMLWMRSYPGTMVARTQEASVNIQKAFVQDLNIPWGISESGYADKDPSGHYSYFAYGIPKVALADYANAGPVISPYSTFLALNVDTPGAISNLRRMAEAGWVGAYGFYEAADYRASQSKPELVREWMAHHLGMSLLAVGNLLCDNVVQRWFHENSVIESTERLLHEVPLSNAILKSRLYELASTSTD